MTSRRTRPGARRWEGVTPIIPSPFRPPLLSMAPRNGPFRQKGALAGRALRGRCADGARAGAGAGACASDSSATEREPRADRNAAAVTLLGSRNLRHIVAGLKTPCPRRPWPRRRPGGRQIGQARCETPVRFLVEQGARRWRSATSTR